GLENLPVKFSGSESQPFRRMLVRIKREIISFGVEGIDPAAHPSPKLAPRELKQWLDEGRPVTLLDTRNDYEIKLGTFKNARPAGIGHFRDFPRAVRQLPPEMKERPIVMFCTGGIRCEKAGPFMEREGFKNIFQLEGGILKYFEECGGEHYEGECFVFDQRVGVDPALRETETAQCFVCQTPLDAGDQADFRYAPGESCPYCYRTPAEKMGDCLIRRQVRLREVSAPLPGSVPYDNLRPVNVPASYAGCALLDFLCGFFAHVPREEWREVCARGQYVNDAGETLAADHVVRAGERCLRVMPATVEPDVNAGIRFLYEDEAILVLDKPAPLPMHPSGRFNRNTLQYLLRQVYAPQSPHPAHRLDANTTGLVVCARTRHFAKFLQPQFARGEVAKTYLARVHGHPAADTFASEAPISAGPGELGSREVDEIGGRPARTEFTVRSRNPDGTSLLEVRPLTGRTNQIRVHLWQLGFPIVGDPAYLENGTLGEVMTLAPGDPPLRLHAWRLAFRHPLTNEPVSFETEKPEWSKP
ncbi:MAG TPA: pseudouridine synthase, partial [Chthoniobacterales bacterium]